MHGTLNAVQSTRARIIDLLRRGGDVTIEDVTQCLSLAPATVRRHLDVLQRDGLVEMRAERRPLGRPHFVFGLTDAGRDSLPEYQLRLALRVLQELLAFAPADTRHCSGRDIAVRVFDRLARRLAEECKPESEGSEPAQRLQRAIKALNHRGLSFELVTSDDGDFIVRGTGCPCQRLLSTEENDRGCSHDRSILGTLLETEVKEIPREQGQREYLLLPVKPKVL